MTKEITEKKKEKIITIESKDTVDEKFSPQCPHCHSKDVYGMSRVVGYFSVIDNWNDSKKSEFKRRQKGNYWSQEVEEKH